jgi:hypothetical protein
MWGHLSSKMSHLPFLCLLASLLTVWPSLAKLVTLRPEEQVLTGAARWLFLSSSIYLTRAAYTGTAMNEWGEGARRIPY